MAKPNFNYIRKLINTKLNNYNSNYCERLDACHKESNKLLAAAVKKASKETLAGIIIKDKWAYDTLKVPRGYALMEQKEEERKAPYKALLNQLDALELKAAMGDDPSEELKKIVAAIEKL